MKRTISMISMVLVLALMLTGCSSGGDTAANHSVKVVVAAPYVIEGGLAELETAMKEGLPELNTEESSMLIQAVNTGDTAGDPMGAMAGMTKITTMFLGKEIEIMIMDAENAQRHGEGGSAYMTLDKLFTAEELAELSVEELTVSKVDEDGNVTGELSDPIGISLANCEGIKNIFKMSDLGLYVVDTPEAQANIENIRTAVRFILGM